MIIICLHHKDIFNYSLCNHQPPKEHPRKHPTCSEQKTKQHIVQQRNFWPSCTPIPSCFRGKWLHPQAGVWPKCDKYWKKEKQDKACDLVHPQSQLILGGNSSKLLMNASHPTHPWAKYSTYKLSRFHTGVCLTSGKLYPNIMVIWWEKTWCKTKHLPGCATAKGG